MKKIICTIITADYAHYALAMYDSFKGYDSCVDYCVLVSRGDLSIDLKKEFLKNEILVLHGVDFNSNALAVKLHDKYFNSYHDAYRWGMKPIVMLELIKKGYDKIIYLDCDIHFFNDYTFLWDDLNHNSMLLSPHWRCSDPRLDEKNFRHNFLDGIYNGGFIGVSKGSEQALNYWAELCLFKCEVNRNDGYYVDQRYLDIIPTRFKDVGHIQHMGCNVSNWNIVDCKRVLQANGEVFINNEYPIIFIHFTNSLFKGAYVWKDDTLLIPYIEKYRDDVLKYYKKDIIDEFFEKGIQLTSRTEAIVEEKKDRKNFVQKLFNKF